jgi:hypothetical protein
VVVTTSGAGACGGVTGATGAGCAFWLTVPATITPSTNKTQMPNPTIVSVFKI